MDERDEIIREYEELLRNWKRRCARLEDALHKTKMELELAQKSVAGWKECATLGYPEVITRWMESTQLMPCGHPRSAIVSSNEGTQYCGRCEREARK